MKIYTRSGDDGTTELSGGRRIPKHSLRVEAYGTVEELIAWVGLLKDLPENSRRQEFLNYIQGQLMKCTSVLASENKSTSAGMMLPDVDTVLAIEKEIDLMDKELSPLRSFIMPGGNLIISYCHIARCVCRRAERSVLRLKEAECYPEIINVILNRLSDYLFILSRKLCLELDIKEVEWP